MRGGTITLILILSPLILFSHHRRDELCCELQVAEVGELGGDEAQHGVLAVDVQPGDLGPERHEGPQARVLACGRDSLCLSLVSYNHLWSLEELVTIRR